LFVGSAWLLQQRIVVVHHGVPFASAIIRVYVAGAVSACAPRKFYGPPTEHRAAESSTARKNSDSLAPP
jgi:hypothetical protein